MKKIYIAILIVLLSLTSQQLFSQAPVRILPVNGDKEKVREDEGNQYQALQLKPAQSNQSNPSASGYSRMPEGPAIYDQEYDRVNVVEDAIAREKDVLARLDNRTLKGLNKFRNLKDKAKIKQAQGKAKEAVELNQKAQKKQDKIFSRTRIQFDQPPNKVQIENFRRLRNRPQDLDPASPEARYLSQNVRDLSPQPNQNTGNYGAVPELESERRNEQNAYGKLTQVKSYGSPYEPGPIPTTTTTTTTNNEYQTIKLAKAGTGALRAQMDKYGPFPTRETNNLIDPEELRNRESINPQSVSRLVQPLKAFYEHYTIASNASALEDKEEVKRQADLMGKARDKIFQETGLYFEEPPEEEMLEMLEKIARAPGTAKKSELILEYDLAADFFRQAISDKSYDPGKGEGKEKDKEEESEEK